MDESVKRKIMIGLAVLCLAAAAVVISSFTNRGNTGGIESIDPTARVWMLCRDPDCQAAFEVSKKAYYTFMQENANPGAMEAPPYPCQACGRMSAYKAVKCPRCEIVFEEAPVNTRDFRDRCPECGFSATEQRRRGN